MEKGLGPCALLSHSGKKWGGREPVPPLCLQRADVTRLRSLGLFPEERQALASSSCVQPGVMSSPRTSGVFLDTLGLQALLPLCPVSEFDPR